MGFAPSAILEGKRFIDSFVANVRLRIYLIGISNKNSIFNRFQLEWMIRLVDLVLEDSFKNIKKETTCGQTLIKLGIGVMSVET